MSRHGSYSKASSVKKLAVTILTILQGLICVQASFAGQPSSGASPRKLLPAGQINLAPSLIPITGYQSLPNSFIINYAKSKQVIQTPTIQYLPGYEGETIMVCDFPLLNWTDPTFVIPFAQAPGTRGIKQIRIGQFQALPPILRIAITTTDPKLFAKISINSTGEKLVLKWTAPQSSAQVPPLKSAANFQVRETPTPDEPPIAPAFTKPKTVQVALAPRLVPNTKIVTLAPQLPSRKPAAGVDKQQEAIKQSNTAIPAIHKIDKENKEIEPYGQTEAYVKSAWLLSKKSFKSWFSARQETVIPESLPNRKRETESIPTRVRAPIAKETSTPAEPVNDFVLSDDLSLKVNEDESSLEIESKTPIRYNAFSLNDPPRYVIDFEGLPDLAKTRLPVLLQKGPIKSLRIGNPNAAAEQTAQAVIAQSTGTQDGENLPATRLVIDIDPASFESLAVQDKLNSTSTKLIITLGNGMPELTGELPSVPQGKIIVLDAGHGGSDPGAQRGVIQEKEITLAITQKLEKILRSKGIKTVMTRFDDTFVSLQDRVTITNRTKPDAFVSIHINSLETTSDIHGIETYYQTTQSQNLAQFIHQSLVGNLQAPDRYVRKARFYVINHTEVPSILAEVGFISNVKEREKLISPDYQNQIAESLARGVILYLNERSIAQNKTPNQQLSRTLTQHAH